MGEAPGLHNLIDERARTLASVGRAASTDIAFVELRAPSPVIIPNYAAFSYAFATRRIVLSAKCLPKICIPIGSLSFVIADRNRNPRNAGQICGHGVNVRQIHCQRIINFFAQLERRRRTSRRHDRVHFFERIVKVARQQCAHALRFQIISIVISGAQRIRSQHDSAFHLGAESMIARATIHVGQRSRIFRAKSITHAVKARQVRRSLRGRDQVISRNRVFGVRQRNLDDLASQLGQFLNRRLDRTANFGIQAFA